VGATIGVEGRLVTRNGADDGDSEAVYFLLPRGLVSTRPGHA